MDIFKHIMEKFIYNFHLTNTSFITHHYNHVLLLTCDQIYIQYWSIDGEYRIYLTRLRNGVKDELYCVGLYLLHVRKRRWPIIDIGYGLYCTYFTGEQKHKKVVPEYIGRA